MLATPRTAVQGARSVHLVADSAKPEGSIPKSDSEPFVLKLSDESFKSYKIDAPTDEIKVTKEQLVHLYSEMVKMRRMEVAADQQYKHKLIRGFCHLSIGQVSVLPECANDRKPLRSAWKLRSSPTTT